jgi:hypothetical protein
MWLLMLLLNVQGANASLPDCGGGYHNTKLLDSSIKYQGCFQENHGSKLKIVNVTHPYVFPIFRKCWEEIWAVQAEASTTPWAQFSDTLYVSLQLPVFANV